MLICISYPLHLWLFYYYFKWTWLRPGEWRLHPEVVELIWKEFGQAQVDLFVSRETSHCPLWFSLPHPAPLGLDAMTQTWPRLRLCMHFPRLLCSWEYWRVFAGTGSHYFLLPHGGRAEYGFQIYYPFSTGLLWSYPSGGTFCPKRGARYFTPI